MESTRFFMCFNTGKVSWRFGLFQPVTSAHQCCCQVSLDSFSICCSYSTLYTQEHLQYKPSKYPETQFKQFCKDVNLSYRKQDDQRRDHLKLNWNTCDSMVDFWYQFTVQNSGKQITFSLSSYFLLFIQIFLPLISFILWQNCWDFESTRYERTKDDSNAEEPSEILYQSSLQRH